jgi:hypothetical protein
METSSDPREWRRQEELACDLARRRMRGRRSGSLMPMYVAAGLIGVGALYLLLIAAGIPVPGAR